MDLEGSRTEANLMAAFAGESKARNKYTYYASKAQKQGLNQIAEFFRQTAHNEQEHAKIWFKLLHGGEILDTAENLKDAAAGENFEWTEMYATFAKEAKEEGFGKIATLFEKVGEIEREHEKRYLKLLDNLKADTVFQKSKEQEWICQNCGHHHKGKAAPNKCLVCDHPQGFFFIGADNY